MILDIWSLDSEWSNPNFNLANFLVLPIDDCLLLTFCKIPFFLFFLFDWFLIRLTKRCVQVKITQQTNSQAKYIHLGMLTLFHFLNQLLTVNKLFFASIHSLISYWVNFKLWNEVFLCATDILYTLWRMCYGYRSC